MEILVSKDVHRSRLKECEKCEHKTRFHTCALCGCLVFAKAKVANAKCDADKWPKVKQDG